MPIGISCRHDRSQRWTFGILLPFAGEAKSVYRVTVEFHMSLFEIGCYHTALGMPILLDQARRLVRSLLSFRSLLLGSR